MTIRPYKHEDFEMIHSWHVDQGATPPSPGMLVENGTFIVENDGEALNCLTVYLTQTKTMSYITGYCSKPGLKKSIRNKSGEHLWSHCYSFAKSHGYQNVICYCDVNKPKLIKRYENLGMTNLRLNLTPLYRNL